MEILKFVRSIDELGRIVLPVEARDQFDWDARDKIDIFMGSETDAYSWGRRTIDIYILN